jgi:membrane protease YdiL (CAAX protease family)
MNDPEVLLVDWPSLLFAFLTDSVLVWGPAVAVYHLAPGHQIPAAMALVLVFWAVNWALYSRGTTLGTYLAGFRLRTRRRQAPGRKYGLALAAVNLGSLPALAVLVAISYSPVGDASGPLGRADSYPLWGEQIRRRRFLQAADDYWERWS